MGEPHRVLVLDDGELEDLARVLDRLGTPFARMRGGAIQPDLAPPLDLLIATPRHANVVRRGSPTGARPGRPLRIVAVDEDSNSMRRMVRRIGFHLLVRLPAHREVWRMLIQRALYQGEERRAVERVTTNSEVQVTTGRARQKVLLVEVSPGGCRLVSRDPFETGARVSMDLDPGSAHGGPFEIAGRISRTVGEASEDGSITHGSVMIFDADLPEVTRWHLSELLQLQPCDSDPADRATDSTAGSRVGPATLSAELRPSSAPDPNRRRASRGAYPERVVAIDERRSRVLMGRDLSAGGMRVERLPDLEIGDHFRIAVYGPTQVRPFVLEAVVARDDGERGLALRFEGVDPELATQLEKLVACLPDVESLEEGELDGLGSVISEILAPE